MRARDLMSSPAVTCHMNDQGNQVAHEMWEHDCGALPVVNDDHRLVGIITDRDLCMAAFTQARPLDAVLVNSAMATDVVSVRTEQSIAEVEALMAKHQLRRLPVVDGTGTVVGMISLNDLALESVQPDTRMKNGPAKIAHTLAAIVRPRVPKPKAA